MFLTNKKSLKLYLKLLKVITASVAYNYAIISHDISMRFYNYYCVEVVKRIR